MSNILHFPNIKIVPETEHIPVATVLEGVSEGNFDEIVVFARKDNGDGSFSCAVFTSVGGPRDLLLLLEIAKARIIDEYTGCDE